MRLFLVPISTRRTLIYCQRLDEQLTKKKPSTIDKATAKAAALWAKWEEADKGWKKSLVVYGHSVLKRIPYEEWGLKSVPPLSARREYEELHGRKPIELVYPGNVLEKSRVLNLLRKLATERQDLHRRRMWWSLLVSPFTAPIALIPVIPNIPFFSLVYRGWSHWRALNGSKHLEFLLNHNLVNPTSMPELEHIYLKHVVHNPGKDRIREIKEGEDSDQTDDIMLLKKSEGKELAKVLHAPELAAEVERAVEQVEKKHS